MTVLFIRYKFTALFANVFIIALFYLFTSLACAEVIVFDDITHVKQSIQLRALTKGRFFPEGGRLVTFYVEDNKIGTTLSGGDGFAFLKYTPASAGILSVMVEAGEDTDEGVLLAAAKKDKLLVVEIEGTLVESLFSLQPVKDSNEILRQLSQQYRILYLTTLIGVKQSKAWLMEYKFPSSAVQTWEGAEMLSELQERGIQIYTVIASPAVLSEVSGIDNKFSFKETEAATEVKDWNDLFEKLNAH